METKDYRNDAKTLVSIPKCETCENYIKRDLLHCRCYDQELKLWETEVSKSKTEPEEKTELKKTATRRIEAVVYFLESRKWVWYCAIVAVLVGCVACWFYSQPRFHDLTVELGTETISIEDFMTKFANRRNVGIVTDLSTIDISVVGSSSLTLRSGHKNETVTLTVQDTSPPQTEFISLLQKTSDYIPDPYDFIESCHDLSDVTVYFAEDVADLSDYEDHSFTVVVEDACGNAVSQVCTLSIVWMKSEYMLELGEVLSKEDLLFNPERDSYRINQEDIDVINESGIGEYTVASLVDQKVCVVHVADTTPPELIVKDFSVFKGEKVTADNFVESCFDISGDVEVYLVTKPDVSTLGTQIMTIEAMDINGNTATATATLAVVRDKNPPVIKGLKALSVAKNSNPDYLSGVKAIDAADGVCEVICDARNVDLTVAGTYYVTYTSKDKDGNTATSKRKVVVEHDQRDTDALADSIADMLGSDSEEIRDYIRDTIKYSTNAGGEDPVWYGFTNKAGNCLVHALCLQSILVRKGYETQLIWVTDKSHYWLIVHLDEGWRHIDATPGRLHTKYSLMTDEQRYEILQGRNWDRSSWPACE